MESPVILGPSRVISGSEPLPIVTVFPTRIDFSGTPQEMIDRMCCGRVNYRAINCVIERSYPWSTEPRPIDIEFGLFNFKEPLSSSDVRRGIENFDRSSQWSPACIEHILAFGCVYPDEPAQKRILALGTAISARAGLLSYDAATVFPLLTRAMNSQIALTIAEESHCLDLVIRHLWDPEMYFLAFRMINPCTVNTQSVLGASSSVSAAWHKDVEVVKSGGRRLWRTASTSQGRRHGGSRRLAE